MAKGLGKMCLFMPNRYYLDVTKWISNIWGKKLQTSMISAYSIAVLYGRFLLYNKLKYMDLIWNVIYTANYHDKHRGVVF